MRFPKRRGIGEIITLLIIVVIAVAIAGVAALMFSGMLSGATARASITVSATGVASPDGSLASITLTLQNTGDGTARVSHIFIETVGSSPSGSPTLLGVTGVSVAMGVPTAPTTLPASGIDITARSTQTIMMRLSGSGIYPGMQYRITVIYFDVGSRTSSSATAIVTLR